VSDDDALDAYSATIVRVAESVLPSVASLKLRTARGRGGAGSASVITSDGYLLTSAHVVAGADTAQAIFTDGTTTTADVVGRDTLSDLAVLLARGATPPPLEHWTPRRSASASSWWHWATRSACPAASPPVSSRPRSLPSHRVRPGRR
jgi:S1-C subfamily serine protease